MPESSKYELENLNSINFASLMTFGAMLRQECGWFDEEENAVGVLASHLSGDASNVQNVTSFNFRTMIWFL